MSRCPSLSESPHPRGCLWAARLIALSGDLICPFLMKICADETRRQLDRDVGMIAAHAVPNAWISVRITHGVAGSALHVLRLSTPPHQS